MPGVEIKGVILNINNVNTSLHTWNRNSGVKLEFF